MPKETHCYVVVENYKELPNADFAAIQGAAAMWAESPETRTVSEVLCGFGTPVRTVPVSELRQALGMITGYGASGSV
jgi:hypothetical protein